MGQHAPFEHLTKAAHGSLNLGKLWHPVAICRVQSRLNPCYDARR
jgi:hypothetical protein